MTGNSKYSKADFIKFVLTRLNTVTTNKEEAKEYLSSQGLDSDAILKEGLKRLKKIQLSIEAERTKKEMLSIDIVKQKATEWVEQMLSKIDFSFSDFIREEKLLYQNRNIESFSPEDIKNTMIQYYTLKFMQEQERNENTDDL